MGTLNLKMDPKPIKTMIKEGLKRFGASVKLSWN